MPIDALTTEGRTRRATLLRFAAFLAFIAGHVDVIGYLDFRQFTSHMTGDFATILASAHEMKSGLVARCAMVMMSFILGGALCALLVNFAGRRDRKTDFALPVAIESLLLIGLGVCGPATGSIWFICGFAFCMGLQNAIITKLSHAEIRTTHITGMLTDFGIELGRALYWNRSAGRVPVMVDWLRLQTLLLLLGAFALGGVTASLAYGAFGHHSLSLLGMCLIVPTIRPVLSDFLG